MKRKLLFALVSKGLVREFVELVEQPLSGLKITDRIGSGGRTGAGLLHFCVAVVKGCQDKPTDPREVQEGKFSIVKYLFSPRSLSLDLGLVDDEGRTVLHLAAMYGDAQLIEFLVEQRSELEKKNHTIDINCRCLNQGWTPLHYAAVSGVLNTVQLLVRLGAILNVHAFVYSPSSGRDSDSKGPTPLELAKRKLRSSRHLPQQERHSFESVINELEKALNRLEVLRQQREAEKFNKESKLREEKQRLAAKEQTERELLERKQKQLKEKQEKERIKNEEDTRAHSSPPSLLSVSVSLNLGLILQLASEGGSKKKKKDKKKDAAAVATAPAVVEAPLPPPVAKPVPPEPAPKPAATSSAASQKSAHHTSHPPPVVTGIVPVIPTPAPAANVLGDVVSRDDLLSHLLAMGFAESDCLAAISSCGLNVDMAVSWLCDPPSPSQPKSKTAEAKESKKSSANKAVPIPNPGASASASAQELDAQLKAQKDKEHKEEQRRINRAWNARVPHQRAEEERKKVTLAPPLSCCLSDSVSLSLALSVGRS
jgi:hypothetical protein